MESKQQQSTGAKEASISDGILRYLLAGMFFGVVLTKSEAVSWFRIQEMFRFQSFHMYGIIGSAVLVGVISLYLIKKFDVRDHTGSSITIPNKDWGTGTRYWLGGTIFGVGWALTGACVGPIFALLGSGVSVMLMVFLSALLGTWTYGALQPHLPH